MHPSVLVENWVLENISSTVIRIYSVPSIVDVQQTGPDSEEAIEMSGCSRHSHVRGPMSYWWHLCGMVVNPNVDLSGAI